MHSATLKVIKKIVIGLGLMLCILGLVLILYPTLVAEAIAKMVAVMFILIGIIRIVGYFSGDIYRLAFQHDLAMGLVMLLLAALLIVNPGTMLDTLCFAIGMVIVADALLKLQTAVDAKRFGLKSWWLILVLAVLTGIFGAFLLFRPGQESIKLMTLFGVSLLAEGALHITTITASMKILEDTALEGEEDE